MEEIRKGTPARGFVRYMLQFTRWQIPEEDLAAARWFTADFLGEVPYGQVNRVRSLIAEEGDLGFVARDDDRYDCGPRLVLLHNFLVN